VRAAEKDGDGGIVASGTVDGCTGTFGASVYCGNLNLTAIPADASVPDAGDAAAPDAPSSGDDGGDPYSSPITFTGTITGNVPPGASYIMVELDHSVHMYATGILGADGPTCATPTVVNGQYSTWFDPTLPLSYSITFANNQPFCAASFTAKAYAADANQNILSGATAGTTYCGEVGNCPGPGATAGCGVPLITLTSVTCNVSLP
jgi:hypothetical protein